jgi:hypothetical protein
MADSTRPKARDPKQRAKVGRPSSYKPEYVEQAKSLAALGATDREVAQFFRIAEATLNTWKHAYPEFLASLKTGKEASDQRVVSSLYRRATGYSYDAVKVFQYQGKELLVPYTEHVPPDTTACIFWLKNRQKADWRDRQEHELTGKDGGAIEVSDPSGLASARRVAFLLARATRKSTPTVGA